MGQWRQVCHRKQPLHRRSWPSPSYSRSSSVPPKEQQYISRQGDYNRRCHCRAEWPREGMGRQEEQEPGTRVSIQTPPFNQLREPGLTASCSEPHIPQEQKQDRCHTAGGSCDDGNWGAAPCLARSKSSTKACVSFLPAEKARNLGKEYLDLLPSWLGKGGLFTQAPERCIFFSIRFSEQQWGPVRWSPPARF